MEITDIEVIILRVPEIGKAYTWDDDIVERYRVDIADIFKK